MSAPLISEAEYDAIHVPMRERVITSVLFMRTIERAQDIIDEMIVLSNYEMDRVLQYCMNQMIDENTTQDYANKLSRNTRICENIKARVIRKIETLRPWILTKTLNWTEKSNEDKQIVFDSIKTAFVQVFTYTKKTYMLMWLNNDTSGEQVSIGHYDYSYSEYDTYLNAMGR